jgi:hypothetical protein
LNELGIEPISERVSPHSLRRTYASVRAAAGDSPVYIAEQIGHTDFGFTFRVYQRAVKRRDKLEGAYLTAFVGVFQWAEIGRKGGRNLLSLEEARLAREPETPPESHNLNTRGR